MAEAYDVTIVQTPQMRIRTYFVCVDSMCVYIDLLNLPVVSN